MTRVTPASGLHSLSLSLPALLRPSTSSEVSKFNLHCSSRKYPLGTLGRMLFSEVREVGSDSPGCTTGCEPQPIDLMWITWESGSSIANPCANHSDTILCVFVACFIYLSQKPCLQQWKWISLSLPALARTQWRLQGIYGLNCNLYKCKKCHPWHQWLPTEKGLLQLTWASNRHAAMAKQMSISPGLTLSVSAFFTLKTWSCFY